MNGEVAVIVTGAVGFAGIVATLLTGTLQRSHARNLAREDRRAIAYVDALAVMDRFIDMATENLDTVGERYVEDERHEWKDRLATNAARLQALGTRRAMETMRQFENSMWAFYGRHAAGGKTKTAMPEGHEDSEQLRHDRGALAKAVDKLRARRDEFRESIRDELGSDKT